jgi:hypothetical protein
MEEESTPQSSQTNPNNDITFLVKHSCENIIKKKKEIDELYKKLEKRKQVVLQKEQQLKTLVESLEIDTALIKKMFILWNQNL